MTSKEKTGGNNNKPYISITFPDCSEFVLPKEWEDIFVDYYGPNPQMHQKVIQRLQFLTGKYVEHKAWPTKFDGLQFESENEKDQSQGDELYDNPFSG